VGMNAWGGICSSMESSFEVSNSQKIGIFWDRISEKGRAEAGGQDQSVVQGVCYYFSVSDALGAVENYVD
jgi:predicted transcriptional regulator YdeE